MSSLRARATIIFVLVRPLWTPSVRLLNHRARALSFWNNRKRQASWDQAAGVPGHCPTWPDLSHVAWIRFHPAHR